MKSSFGSRFKFFCLESVELRIGINPTIIFNVPRNYNYWVRNNFKCDKTTVTCASISMTFHKYSNYITILFFLGSLLVVALVTALIVC